MKFRLIIDVNYDLNGAKRKEIREILGYLASYAACNGLLSQNSNAEVDEWDFKIEELKE